MKMDARRKGLLYVHGAILMFGGTGLFARLIPLPATDIIAWRSVLAALVLMLILLGMKRPLRLQNRRDTLLMLGIGLLLGIHWITYFRSMQVAGVAVGMLALYTSPIMTVFLEPLFHGQRPRMADVVCAALVFLGVLLLVPAFDLHNDITRGVLWGVLSALFFALRNVLQRHYLQAYRGDTSMLYQSAMAALVALPLIHVSPSQFDTATLWKLALLAIVFTAIPHSLFAGSLRYLKAKSVGLIGCLQPVYGTLFAFLILHEQPGWMTLAGGTLIVGTAAWETYRS